MDEQPSPRSISVRTAGRGLAALLLIVAASVWVARSGIGIAELQEMIRRSPAAPVTFLLLHTAASLLFFPRTILAVTAGLLFGTGWGLLWAALGSVTGAVAGFLLSRGLAGGAVATTTMARFADVLRRVESGGWRAVAMLRLVPVVPHSAANYALGLTRLPLGAYALGTLVGQLPMTIAFVQFGAAGNDVLAGKPDWMMPTVTGCVVLALSMLVPRFAARRA